MKKLYFIPTFILAIFCFSCNYDNDPPHVLKNPIDLNKPEDTFNKKNKIKTKANLEIKNKYKNTPLHLAAKNNNKKIVKILLDAGADKKALNRVNRTPYNLSTNKEVRSMLKQKSNY